jgi:hypothetical protein
MGWAEDDSESDSRLPSLDIPPQLASRSPNTAQTRNLQTKLFAWALPKYENIIATRRAVLPPVEFVLAGSLP